MEETEKRKQTINMILRASLICFICCLSAAWAVYGRILLESLGLKGWWIVLALFIFLVIVSVCCCIRQKKWRKIVTVAFFLGLAFFLPLEFKWQGLLAALCLGLALLIPAWRSLPKKSHRSLKPQEDEKFGRAHMYRKHWAQIFRRIVEQNMKPEQQRRGLCVAVTGEWGSGKTHFLSHTVYEFDYWGRAKGEDGKEMTKHDYTGRFFSACVDLWKETSEDDMWREIANALAYTARGSHSDCFWENRLIKSVLQLCHLPLSLADDTAKLLSMGGDGEALIHSRIAQEIHEQNHYSLLVLDNIDRCSIGRLRLLFPVIESLAKIPGLVILCGVAKGNMATIMGQEAPSLCSALLKICDDEIHIPLLSERENRIFRERLQVDEGSRFEKWFQRQELYDVSPRLVKKIRNHLSSLSRMYLERLHGHNAEESKDDAYDFEARCATIFNFEALRIAFPNFPLPVPDHKADVEEKHSSDDKEETFDVWSEHVRKRYGSVMYGEEDPTRHGLFRIATNLSRATTDNLKYLRSQEYTCLTSLTDYDCVRCLREIPNFSDILADHERGAKEIGRVIMEHVEAEDMPYVLRSLYDHCVTLSQLPECLAFMNAFFEHELHQNRQLSTLNLLAYATALSRQSMPEDKIHEALQKILPENWFNPLMSMLEIILMCKNNVNKANDILSDLQDPSKKIRMMLKAFHDKSTEHPYKAILDTVQEEGIKRIGSGQRMDQVLFVLLYATSLINAQGQEMGKFEQIILPECSFEALARIADIILQSIRDKYTWGNDFLFENRRLAPEIREMLQAFHETKDETLLVIRDAVLKEYAKKACKFILAYDGRRDRYYYNNLIFGRVNHPESYCPALMAGAKEYLSSYKPKVTELQQILNAATIIHPISNQLVPFAVLSFAVIWEAIFKKFVETVTLNDEDRLEMRKLKELIENMPPPKKDVSKQFQDNWQAALDILKECLGESHE